MTMGQRTEVTNLFALAFGAHADDTDIGCSGTLAVYANRGMPVGVCDLTHAELSTNGTVETRLKEADLAGKEIGLQLRTTLSFPDRGLQVNEDTISVVADMIRTYRPTLVFAPDFEDRHPDHRQCAAIVEEAVFNAGLQRYAVPSGAAPHRVKHLFYYAINGMQTPDVTIDITDVAQRKQRALMAYGSQFDATGGATPTPLNQGFVEAIIGRDALVGHLVGCRYAEGFRTKKPVLMDFAAVYGTYVQ